MHTHYIYIYTLHVYMYIDDLGFRVSREQGNILSEEYIP